jgi:hypothetical protein
MDAIGEAADDDGPLWQVDVIPAQIASLRDARTVAVDDQSDQPIPVTVPLRLSAASSLSIAVSLRCSLTR